MWEVERAHIALELGDIQRDAYGFAHLQLLAEIAEVSIRKRTYEDWKEKLRPMGKLIWRVRPASMNIGGWPWLGWSQSYAFELSEGMEINSIRQIGTWELGGGLEGVTAVNMRYRGLGKIEHPFEVDENEWLLQSFSTTEIVPGAAGKEYLVSPVLPTGESDGDRSWGLRHRLAAWICRMGRGAGVNFVDFQYHANGMFCSFPDRQGDLRALTEAFPGNRVLSQTDEELFSKRASHESIPQHYLALVSDEAPWSVDESRNRWKEVDQYVRDRVSEELGFVQHDVLPSVGMLWEYRYTEEIERLIKDLPELAAGGVRQILLHNPGWVNGGSLRRGEDGVDEKDHRGGGNCNVYDWVPMPHTREPWKRLKAALAEHQVAYYVWLSGMSHEAGDFAQRVGLNPEHWAMNIPGTQGNPTYGYDMPKHNPHSPVFLREFQKTLGDSHKAFGFQGFWGDSSQNLMFSQLA